MDKISSKILAEVFKPLEKFDVDTLLEYAKRMQDNAQDNIEWNICESALRYARLLRLSEALIDERKEDAEE